MRDKRLSGKVKATLQRISEKQKATGKRFNALGDRIVISDRFYDSLKYLVKKLGWDCLTETGEFKKLEKFVVAMAQEMQEQEKLERFVGNGKVAIKEQRQRNALVQGQEVQQGEVQRQQGQQGQGQVQQGQEVQRQEQRQSQGQAQQGQGNFGKAQQQGQGNGNGNPQRQEQELSKAQIAMQKVHSKDRNARVEVGSGNVENPQNLA